MERNGQPGPAEAGRVEALLAGRAYLDRSTWRRIAVTGSDARAWLEDLVTAGIADLSPGASRRSLLLSRTGRIRADFHVVADGPPGEGFVLVQDPIQPEPVDAVLDRYVLSSDVELSAVDVPVVAVPDGLGPDPRYRLGPPPPGLDPAGEDAEETWRVLRGDPRFGVDLDDDSLPAEAGLDRLVDTTKGCFLGQESVARVRNLGHPPRVVLHLRADGPVAGATAVLAAGEEVGVVTSAVPWEGGTVLLARVRWAARSAPLSAGATALRPAS